MTYDFISPPIMLSFESIRESTAAGGDEDNWTWFNYIERSDLRAAFGENAPEVLVGAPPTSVAPHQPNPWRKNRIINKALLTLGALFAAWVAIYVLMFQSQSPEQVNKVLFQYDNFVKEQASYSKVYGAEAGEDPVLEIKPSEPWSALEVKYTSNPIKSFMLRTCFDQPRYRAGVSLSFWPERKWHLCQTRTR